MTGTGLAEDVPTAAQPGLLLRFPVVPPFSPILEDEADNGSLYADSESEAESQASSEASVHSDGVCVILGFFEPMRVRESVVGRAMLSSRIEWRTLDLTTPYPKNVCLCCEVHFFVK